jgi:hypothetical protein
MFFIQNRLGGLTAFDTPAIEFCASKVGAHAAALLHHWLHFIVASLHCQMSRDKN